MENDFEKEYQLEQDRVLRIYRDEDSESPNNWGNTDMFLVYDHRQFTVKRKGFDPTDIYNHITAVEPKKGNFTDEDDYQLAFNDYAESVNVDYNNYYIFPVAAYIHSGVSLSLTDSLKRQGWDTSVAGFILVHKDCIFIKDKSKTKEQIAKEYAEGLIETWNQYLSGDVWGFRVFYKKSFEDFIKDIAENLQTSFIKSKYSIPIEIIKESLNTETIKELYSYVEPEVEDSCYGFYGSDIKTNGILEHINYKLIENEK